MSENLQGILGVGTKPKVVGRSILSAAFAKNETSANGFLGKLFFHASDSRRIRKWVHAQATQTCNSPLPSIKFL